MHPPLLIASRWRRVFLAMTLLCVALLTGCGGGGGGGGGSQATTTVTGRVVVAESNAAPNPPATVTANGASVATAADGTFTLNGVPTNATQITVTATGSQTLTLPVTLATTGASNLGDIFLSSTGYTATVTGRVVLLTNPSQPVGNATVTLAGRTVKTGTDGTFTIPNLPVGLGTPAGVTLGSITATGFEDKQITSETLRFPLVTGANNIGDIPIATGSGTTPPTLPYTIRGTVKTSGTVTPNISVGLYTQLSGGANGNFLGTVTTDSNGGYSFWVVPGTYNVVATQTAGTRTVSVALQRADQPVTAPDINY